MKICWIFALWITSFTGRIVHGYLDILSQPDVSAIYQKRAELMCQVLTDKAVKEVIWYKVSRDSSRTIVYYFEPPKFNASGPDYKGRSHLGTGQSSLVLKSVRKEDEGVYECHVAVASNVTSSRNEIPEEKSATMQLVVNVPPSHVKMGSFTSGSNLTLTCQTSQSKPPAEVTWYLSRGRETKKLKPAKVVTEYTGNMADTVGYLYLPLTSKDVGVVIECVIEHPQTKTTLVDNVTMVPPTLLHPVLTYFDWLGDDVPYSTYEATEGESQLLEPPNGLVNMLVTPSRIVEQNSSVLVSVTSQGSFPEPSYKWWSEDLDLGSGRVVRIDNLLARQMVFCLVQNPVGSAVMSVQLSTTAAGDEEPTAMGETGDVALLSGAVVAGIAFGSLILLLVVCFIIYYFGFRRSNEELVTTEEDKGDDFDPYVTKEKASMPPSGQTKVSRHDDYDGIITSTEKESLLRNPNDSPPVSTRDSPYAKKHYSAASATSTTTTSGYGDDNGGANNMDTPPADSSASKERAIVKHLHDFDENASFVGDYGSRFGLDDVASPEDEARESPFEQQYTDASDDDANSFDSGASGFEGRYTLPHTDSGSWEEIDPNQAVGAQGKPIKND